MRRIRAFFYGLFMDEELLRAKGVNPTELAAASVDGFRLQIGRRATLVPSPSAVVHGVAAALTQTELDLLYSEPSVRDYRPEAVLAKLSGGEAVAALCFNLPQPPAPEERDEDYAARLRGLAQRLGFPAEYVDSIR